MELHPKDLKPIAELINLVYSGNALDMKNDLHLVIYLLHYVESEYVNKTELERVVYMLNELGKKLMDIQEQPIGRP